MMTFDRKITFIRHGKPDTKGSYPPFLIVSGSEIDNFIKLYNNCELISNCKIPDILKQNISNGDYFISSNLKRTIDSFKKLEIITNESNKLFNEAELPYGIGKKSKLPFTVWLIFLRIFWRFGYNNNSESHNKFTMRIVEGADYLERMFDRKHIVVMAHGFVNRMIVKELLRRNWRLQIKNGGHKYWSFTTLGK